MQNNVLSLSYNLLKSVKYIHTTYIKGRGSSLLLFGIMIFEILVGRNTPSIWETFGEIFRNLRQMGCVPRPCPNMGRKFKTKVVIMVLNLKLLVYKVELYNNFQIGPKIPELWAKNVYPYMGAHTILGYNSALKWENFNIFA